MRRLLAPLFAILLSACATTAGYEKILNSWVGADEVSLVRQWGPPMRSYEAGGIRFLTYAEVRNVYIPGTQPTYSTQIIGNTAYTTAYGGSPGYNIRRACQTTFEVVNGRVSRWQWKGNDCRALEK